MSAFCDIWIGTSGPAHTREGNEAWQAINASYHLSQPKDMAKCFCEQYMDNEGNFIIVLGQFYETVALNSLLNDCLQYAADSKPYNDPAGHYILFVHDVHKKHWHVFTNRCGTYHAYWMQETGNGIIATSFMQMVQNAGSRKLDWQGLSGFFSMGYFPNDRTYLESIKIFDAASHYHFDEEINLLKKRRYWDWSYSPISKSTEENIYRVNNLLTASINHATTQKKVALPISGGLDSRMVAGIMAKDKGLYKSIWAYSYGYNKESIEIEIASKIAKAKSIDFDGYVVPGYLFEEMDKIVSATDLFSYVDGTRQACMLHELRTKADVVVGGHGGDLWFGSINATDRLPMPEYYQKKIKKKGSDWLLDNICARYIDEPDRIIEDTFLKHMQRYSDIGDESFRLKAYKTDQWCARWTHTGIRMYQQAVFPILPFYDKRIIDIFSTIPDEQLYRRGLQIELIKKLYPDLAAIKWQEYESNLYKYKQFNNRNIVVRAVKKVKRVLSSQPTIIRNWELFYLNAEGKRNLQHILIDQGILNDIIPVRQIQNMLDEFYKHPTAANGYTISMLHTFAQFIKRIN